MSFTEKTIVDQITVLDDGIVLVREANIIEKDGSEISKTYHRYSLNKGQDISSQPNKVKVICQAAWA